MRLSERNEAARGSRCRSCYCRLQPESAPGSLLVEVSTADISLDKAIFAGHLFSAHFPETVMASREG